MKKRLIGIILGMAISFALPTFSQDQKAVDPEARQQIQALFMKFGEASSNSCRA
jgi:hypothetical protein